MFRPFRALPALVLLLALLAAGPAEAAKRYVVSADSVYVRNGPAGSRASGYVLGTLFGRAGAAPNVSGTEHFDLIRKSSNGKWAYGYAHGHFGTWGAARCGWVLVSAIRSTGKAVGASCPGVGGDSPSDDHLAARRLFARGSYVSGTGGGTVQPAVIVPCAHPYAYANYDPATGKFANKYPVALTQGRGTTGRPGVTSGYEGFGTRYQTKDGRAWMIKDSRSPAGGGQYKVPVWHFVRSECIRRA